MYLLHYLRYFINISDSYIPDLISRVMLPVVCNVGFSNVTRALVSVLWLGPSIDSQIKNAIALDPLKVNLVS